MAYLVIAECFEGGNIIVVVVKSAAGDVHSDSVS